jgi:hypothetical protein
LSQNISTLSGVEAGIEKMQHGRVVGEVGDRVKLPLDSGWYF